MIAGIGVDVVEVARFERALSRTPALLERLFLPEERQRPLRSLAVRFAAKEAALKALGEVEGFSWQSIEVLGGNGRPPVLRFAGAMAAALAERGIDGAHVTLSHDGGLAVAMVVLERTASSAAGVAGAEASRSEGH